MSHSQSAAGLSARAEVATLVNHALQLLRAAKAVRPTTARERRTAYQAAGLYRANEDDSRAVHAALYSAIIELRRAPPAGAGTPLPADPDDQLARELVRIAYNRARCQQRRGDRLRVQAERGEAQTACGGRAISALEDKSCEILEIHAQIEALLGSVYEGLDSRDRAVLTLSAEGHGQQEVARRVGCDRSTVSRVLTRVRHRFDDMLRQDERD